MYSRERKRERESKASGLIAAIKRHDIMNDITWAAWTETDVVEHQCWKEKESAREKQRQWKRVIY